MKKKSKRKLMRRALDRKDIVMNRIQLSYETLDYLEKLFCDKGVIGSAVTRCCMQ